MDHKNILPTSMLTSLVTYNSLVSSANNEVIHNIKYNFNIISNCWYNSDTVNIADFYVMILVILFMLGDISWYIYKNQHSMLAHTLKNDMSNQN